MSTGRACIVVFLVLGLVQPSFEWWKAYGGHGGKCYAVHCMWGGWGRWSKCPATCGDTATQYRERYQVRQNRCGGRPCRGDQRQERKCNGDCGPTEPECKRLGGYCSHVNYGCDGVFADGLCKVTGSSCCVPKSACTITPYTNTYIEGNVMVDEGFRVKLDGVNQAAKECGVKVHVEKSWVMMNKTIEAREIPKSPCHSAHPVGHAIDFHLSEDGDKCNTTCLTDAYEQCEGGAPKCFLLKVQDQGLRWGGAWSEELRPGHLDDNFFRRRQCDYADTFARLQMACSHLQGQVPLY